MTEPTPVQKIEAARQRVAELDAQLGDLAGKRRGLLIAGAPADEIARFDGELERLKCEQATEQERIDGLAEIIREQEVKAVIARKEKQIERNAKKLDQTLKDAKELERIVANGIEIFHRICKTRNDLLPQFNLGDPETDMGIRNPDGAAMSPQSIATLLAFELFRQGARPITVPGTPIVEPSWPKPISPRLEWAATPERVRPLSETLAAANNYALELMRTGRAPALLAAAEQQAAGETRSAAQIHLGELLSRQAALANDTSKEAEYMLLMQQIAIVQDKVEAERAAFTREVASTEAAERTAGKTPAQIRLGELQMKSAKLVMDQRSHTPEYLKISAELAAVADEVAAELKAGAAA